MKKKIIIEIETEESDERIFKFFKNFCIDNFQNFKIELGDLKEEFQWKKVN